MNIYQSPLSLYRISIPLNLHSTNSSNSSNSTNSINPIDSMNSLDGYRFGQVAGFVGVAAPVDSYIVGQELKGNYGDHGIE